MQQARGDISFDLLRRLDAPRAAFLRSDARAKSVASARRRRTRGITLIEIMIVVVIMGMMAAAAGMGVMSAKKEADLNLARSDIRSLASVVEAFQLLRANECPTLVQLRESDLLKRGSATKDPWGTDYVITCDDTEPDVRSWGPDRAENTTDDVTLGPQAAAR